MTVYIDTVKFLKQAHAMDLTTSYSLGQHMVILRGGHNFSRPNFLGDRTRKTLRIIGNLKGRGASKK